MPTSLPISIVALLFSGISLGWSIYQYYDKIRRKLTIKNKGKILVDDFRGQRTRFYSFIVTNIGQMNVNIDKYEFYLDSVTDGSHFAFKELITEKRTPIKIEAGSQEEFSLSVTSVNQIMDENKANKIRIVIIDTHGKRYEGAWVGKIINS